MNTKADQGLPPLATSDGPSGTKRRRNDGGVLCLRPGGAVGRSQGRKPLKTLLLLFLLALPAFAQPPVGPQNNWAVDVLTLTNGAVYRGLILKEVPDGMHFRAVSQTPGKPTFTFTTYFVTKEIRAAKKLSDDDRADLRAKLAALDTDGSGERARMLELTLTRVDWSGTRARRYDGERFILTSAAPEEVTRRAAVRLEQIFTCYARILPPRHNSDRPTRVELTGDLDHYRRRLQQSADAVLNPAVYDPAANRILVGTDLRRLGQDLNRARIQNAQQLSAVAKYEQRVREQYKGSRAELGRFLAVAERERRKVFAADRVNESAFDEATRRLFGILYHEAFHSYATTFVYPPLSAADVKAGKGTGELPLWLNEGLAQVFENPFIEAGELRIGHADPERLKRVKDGLAGKKGEAGLLPLAELLKAGPRGFLAAHASELAVSDRTYRTAWAAAFYLTFERRLVGGKEFDDYLKALNTGTDPLTAFETWVGQPVAAFETDWHRYLSKLRPDGRVEK